MRSLTVDSLNPAVRNVQYAVRGELAIKAEEYRVMLKEKGQNSGLPPRPISSTLAAGLASSHKYTRRCNIPVEQGFFTTTCYGADLPV